MQDDQSPLAEGPRIARPAKPGSGASEVKMFRLKGVEADHIVGVSWDGTDEGTGEIKIGKPHLLRRTPWDDQLRGDKQYHYITHTKRQWVIEGEGSGYEFVKEEYMEDDLIFAERQIIGGIDLSVDETPVVWLDLNVDARHWQAQTGIGTIYLATSSPHFLYQIDALDFGIVLGPVGASGTPTFGIGGNSEVVWYCSHEPKVYELDPVDLSIIREETGPGADADGIGGTEERIWHASGDSGMMFELDPTDFSIIQTAETPGTAGDVGMGGSNDTVWHCDPAYGSTVYKVDPEDLSIIKQEDGPISDAQGIGGDAWVIWHTAIHHAEGLMELDPIDISLIRWGGTPLGNPAQGCGGKFE